MTVILNNFCKTEQNEKQPPKTNPDLLHAKTAKRCIDKKNLCWVDISPLLVFFFCAQMLAVLYGNKGVSL